ncbi:MAG: hypothetical protein ABI192_07660 [Bradyrhizobium sp.]
MNGEPRKCHTGKKPPEMFWRFFSSAAKSTQAKSTKKKRTSNEMRLRIFEIARDLVRQWWSSP